jgi:trans-2-enoyl-CoA reductase
MIRDDQDWQNLVRNIANKSANNSESKTVAVEYLWDHHNWDRLRETSYGRFLREVNNPCPDLILRSIYRKEVLAS